MWLMPLTQIGKLSLSLASRHLGNGRSMPGSLCAVEAIK